MPKNKKNTKMTNVEYAQARAEEIKAAQKQKDQKRRNLMIGLISVVALAGVALIIFLVVSLTGREAALIKQTKDLVETPIDAPAAPKGVTASGGISIGKAGLSAANEGVPTVKVYSDFICPACGYWEQANADNYIQKAVNGEITLELHPVPLMDAASPDDTYSTRATSFAYAILDSDPEHFLAVYKGLFSSEFQPGENSKYVKVEDSKFIELAVSNGVSSEKANAAVQGAWTEYSNAVTTYARKFIKNTPSVFVNDILMKKTSAEEIDQAIAEDQN